jgi:hypothetical protein
MRDFYTKILGGVLTIKLFKSIVDNQSRNIILVVHILVYLSFSFQKLLVKESIYINKVIRFVLQFFRAILEKC